MTDVLELWKNKVQTIPLTFQNSDGTPYPITGKTIYFTVKKFLDEDLTDALVVLSKSTSTHTGTATTEIELSAADTANIDYGYYYFDVQIELDVGQLAPSSLGKVYIKRPVKLENA